MKIGLVSESYPPGTKQGGPISAQLLVEQLRDRGHEVEVLSFMEEHPEDPEYVIREDLPSERNDLIQLFTYRRIKDFAEDKDVVHSYNRVFDPSVGLLRNTKTVSTLNNFMFDYPRKIPGRSQEPSFPPYRAVYDTLARQAVKRIDKFAALSPHMKEHYSKTIPEENIEVIPNMYDPSFPEFNGIETDENELLYVGALREHKGVQDLLGQIPELPDRYHLRIVGDGPMMDELRQQVEELGIENRVVFEGYVDHSNLPKYYEQAGWFIHPGRWPEPFNRTLLEAMQMKLPILATNLGGPKDLLSDEQLFDKHSEIANLLEVERERLISAQESVLEKSSPDKVLTEIERLYRNE